MMKPRQWIKAAGEADSLGGKAGGGLPTSPQNRGFAYSNHE